MPRVAHAGGRDRDFSAPSQAKAAGLDGDVAPGPTSRTGRGGVESRTRAAYEDLSRDDRMDRSACRGVVGRDGDLARLRDRQVTG